MNREDRLERTMSMAHNKGLLNLPGENNCFLNSAVQVLWHLDVFRRSFREIQGHFCLGKSCIFCALKTIFDEFQYGTDTALPPDALRIALAQTFKDQMRFQMGDMDDAAECFENILARIHFHVSMNENSDGCDAKHCISHQKFAMQIIEQTICECGEMSEPLPFFQLVHYVSASALCSYSRSLLGEYRGDSDADVFGKLLRNAGEDIRECSAKDCKEKVQVQRLLLNSPDIVSVGLIWDSDSPEIEHISEVLQCIGTILTLQDLYHQVYDKKARHTTMKLVGIVTYYGKHYSTFFFHNRLKTWIYFDDARVKEIGPNWSEIIHKCRRCHYQPLLLLYANPQGTPVDTHTAPTKVELVNGATPFRAEQKKRPAPISEETEVVSRTAHEQERDTQLTTPKPGNRSPKVKKSRSQELADLPVERHFSNSNLHRARSNELLDRFPEENSAAMKRSYSTDVLTSSKTSLRVNSRELLNESSRDSGLKSSNSRGFLDIPSAQDIRRTRSSELLDSPTSDRFSSRASSVGSDSASAGGKSADECHSPGKERSRKERSRRKSLKKLGSAIKHAMNPMNLTRKRNDGKEKSKNRRESDDSENEKDLINLNVKTDPAKEAIMALYEQSKAHHLNRLPSTGIDSGIGSTPSSATGSVSSTDTNHGGSDEDLIDLTQNGPAFSRSKDSKARELLRKGDEILRQSQQYEKHGNYESALCRATEATTFYRLVAESMPDATPVENEYAQKRRNECLIMARNLRQFVQAWPEPAGQPPVSFNQENEEELLRKQRMRDELIMRQQQQIIQGQRQPARAQASHQVGHGTLPRRLPSSPGRKLNSVGHPLGVIKEKNTPREPESRLKPSEDYYSNNQTSPFSTLPLKSKINHAKPHYTKNHSTAPASCREGSSVCSQQIKPDTLCYSPVHHDRARDAELAIKMRDVSIRPTFNTARVFSVEDDRSSTTSQASQFKDLNRTSQVATKTIYISPPKQTINVRPAVSQPYDSRRYTDTELYQREPSTRPPTQRYQAVKRGSYYDNLNEYVGESLGSSTDSLESPRSITSAPTKSSDQRLPSYREPPSYERHQLRDANQQPRNANQQLRDANQQFRDPNQRLPETYQLLRDSNQQLRYHNQPLRDPNSKLTSYHINGPNMSRPWMQNAYPSYPDQSSGYRRGDSDDLRRISARINSERPLCACCQGVPVDRRQVYCAACQATLRIKQEHERENAGLY